MDLRIFRPSPEQVQLAARLLDYQPFVIDDTQHSGVAYSWLYSENPRSDAQLFFDRGQLSEETWHRAYEANRRLAAMYDSFVEAIAGQCKGGTYLDVGCNTGYLPVCASVAGVDLAVGMDLGDYEKAFELLNAITGSSAKFTLGRYDSLGHCLTLENSYGCNRFDVVSSCALLCHLPDPLHFLKAIAGWARKAVFLWSGFVASDELLIRYGRASTFGSREFPDGFDDGTSISTGLLQYSMSELGFSCCVELQRMPDWLETGWHQAKLPDYQEFRAFMFRR